MLFNEFCKQSQNTDEEYATCNPFKQVVKTSTFLYVEYCFTSSLHVDRIITQLPQLGLLYMVYQTKAHVTIMFKTKYFIQIVMCALFYFDATIVCSSSRIAVDVFHSKLDLDVSSSKYYPRSYTLKLYCHVNTNLPIKVFDSENISKPFVDNSIVQPDYIEEYDFNTVNATTAVFIIKDLKSDLNNTLLVCQGDERQSYVNIKVIKLIEDSDLTCTHSLGLSICF